MHGDGNVRDSLATTHRKSSSGPHLGRGALAKTAPGASMLAAPTFFVQKFVHL